MTDISPIIHIPAGIWTDALAVRQRDYAEALLDRFGLRRLDTRDRDMARHAIYHALLFGPRPGRTDVKAADEASIRGGEWTEHLSDAQRQYTEALLDQFEMHDLDEYECELVRQAVHYALMFGPHAKSDVEEGSDGIVIPDGPWTESLSSDQQTYVEALADRLAPHGLATADRDLMRQAVSHALLFGPRSEPVAVEATTRST